MMLGILLFVLSIVMLIKRHTEEEIKHPFRGKNLVILIVDLLLVFGLGTLVLLSLQ
mgnify:CR=1 FL=1|jgi:hypothetical protein